MRILVVDDSAVDRHLLVSLLQEMGHQVDEFASTEGVIGKLTDGQYPAMFLDIVMPEQDGYKFLRELRSNPTTAKQHVIFCSSKRTPLEVKYGIEKAGANAYIAKPPTREAVSEVLQKVSV
jgi:two-component system chemotaxis response regulator CheY